MLVDSYFPSPHYLALKFGSMAARDYSPLKYEVSQ